jgi:hypothetical protein
MLAVSAAVGAVLVKGIVVFGCGDALLGIAVGKLWSTNYGGGPKFSNGPEPKPSCRVLTICVLESQTFSQVHSDLKLRAKKDSRHEWFFATA